MIRPRPALDHLHAYRPGRPPGARPDVNLAANENAWGPSPRVSDAILQVGVPSRYPELGGLDLAAALGEHLSVSPAHLLFGTGSGHLIKCIAETYLMPDDPVLTVFPTFSLYAHDARLMGARVMELSGDGHAVPWERLPARVTEIRPRLVFLASPNNPTGDALPPPILDEVLARLPDESLLVIDEAYVHFSNDPAGFTPRILSEERVAVLRTFSKAFGLAAYRVGALAAAPEIIEAVGKVREPFPLSAVGVVAATAALADEDYTAMVVRATREGRDRLTRELGRRGWTVGASAANFVWARPPRGQTADDIRGELAEGGVLVRAGAGFGVTDHLRITVGTPEELDRLFVALDRR